MAFLSSLILVLTVLSAVVFSVLVLVTGKGDAMSGGGSVRTTYKGKATFDDIMSKGTLYTGIAFMAFVLLYQVVNRPATATKPAAEAPVAAPTNAPVDVNVPAKPSVPEVKAPVANAPTSNASSTNAPAAANTPANPATNPPVKK